MKNLEIFKIKYRSNTTRKMRYKIVPADKVPKFTSKVTSMQSRTVPKLIAKHIIANNYLNRGLSKKYHEIIWKLSYPNQILHSYKYELKNIKPNIKAIKYNITELYKRLTTKDYVVPEYKWVSSASGELFKDWKEVSEDMWWNIKQGYLPPIYAYNPENFIDYMRKVGD